jgi:hypothetical protein
VEKVGVCDSVGGLARSRRVSCSCRALCCCGGTSFRHPPGTIPACFFYSLKEVQGYKMLAYGVTLLVEDPEASEGPYPVGHDMHCGGMASTLLALLLCVLACVPLLKEWSLSFGIVAMCLVIPGPVAGVAYLSL